jgi:hypothetical protein
MIPPSNSEHGFTLAVIETGLTIIAIATAFCWPRFGSRQFVWIESTLKRVALRKHLAVALSGLTVLVLRVALLPLFPIPLPFLHDDFSFLLAADTFASGRLTNPTPLMWTHFESFHITMFPTYMSMYFPAQGLLLAAGKVFLGHPWFGILIVDALMCSALCWMLQAWLPPTWAFLGAMLAVLRLGLFSYWINTYIGGGFIAALGGALVLGALPRLMRGVQLRYGLLMAVGIVLLATSRPYEGLLLCLPVAAYLGHWLLFGTNRPTPARLFRCAALPLLLVIFAGAWMAYYDYRVFGRPLTLPYTINRATYGIAPYYVWQSPRPEPVYRHAVMRDFYAQDENRGYKNIHSLSGYLPNTMMKAVAGLLFFAGVVLTLPLIMVRRVLMDRRLRFLVICVFVLMAGMAIEIFLIPHYLAPFTAVFYALGLQAMRHLRVWRPGGQPVGLAWVRFAVVLCCTLGVLRATASPLHIVVPEWPMCEWAGMWYGPDHYGTERVAIEDKLDHLPGKQLVLVRYSTGHDSEEEWVHNSPDIDNSKVIWAREMDAAENARLLEYYSDRNVWLVQPDSPLEKLSSYSLLEKSAAPGQ